MNAIPPDAPSPDDVLDFWFGDAALSESAMVYRGDLWFGGGAALDARMRERFGTRVDQALSGGLPDWEGPLPARLALLLLLDQFSRNVHRGSARAFAGDGRAQKLVLQTLALAQDADLPPLARLFLYMPLMHAESRSLQYECVERIGLLLRHSTDDLRPAIEGSLRSAKQHRDIIDRFGRFPHRNAVLGRASTAAEDAFLADGPRFGQ